MIKGIDLQRHWKRTDRSLAFSAIIVANIVRILFVKFLHSHLQPFVVIQGVRKPNPF
jgi:hypothetical protein